MTKRPNDQTTNRPTDQTTNRWFPYFDLGCALLAGAIWYLRPEGVAWAVPLGIGLLPWAVRWALTGRPSRRTPYDGLLPLFLATGLISVWAAYDPQVAWEKFWLLVGAVLIFYALANARALWPKDGPAAADGRVWLLTGLGVLVSGYFMATHDWAAMSSPIAVIDRLGAALQRPLPTLPGHRLNPNVAGGLLAFAAPFAAALALTAGKRWATAVGWLALLFILFGLLLTVSRGAWLALAGATGLWLLWRASGWLAPFTLARRIRASRRARFRRQLLIWLTALALPPLLLVAFFWLWSEPALPAIMQRAPAIVQRLPASLGDANRVALWQGGLLLASEYPFTGAGMGGFMMLYSSYILLIHVGHSFHAHNLFLNVALEQGTPALLLLVAGWLLVARHTLAWLRPVKAGDPAPGAAPSGAPPLYAPALGAAALALVTMLLHGLVDDVFYGSRSLLFLFAPLAFAMPRRSGARRRRGEAGRAEGRRAAVAPLIGWLSLALLLLFVGWRPLTAAWYANLGAVAQSQAELSVYRWPEWDIQDRVRREADLDTAVAHFERALAWNPANGAANKRLGMIALARQEYPAALTYLEAAHAAAPWANVSQQLLGEAYLVNGRLAEGQALWANVNTQQRQLDIRVYWYSRLNDPERLAWIRAGIAGNGP